jgi:MFS transporter, ACS family, hexuronate transporter
MRRWWIAIIACTAIAISYLDRQTLPVAISAIQKTIPITNTQFAELQDAFLLAYAGMYLGGGKLMDWLGTRWGFVCTMVFWSLACASHGLAGSFAALAVSRFLLGMGEGGGFPAATRAVAEWFPVEERSLAMGIINGGSAVGGVIAPPLIALVIVYANWRSVFFLTGFVGLLWTFWWAWVYAPPEQPIGNSAAECELSWMDLLRFPQVWGVVIAKFLSDAAWYFYLFWLPKYLYDARGFDIKAVGAFAWIPYAAAGVGCLAGGWLSGWLVRRNHSLNFARKAALAASAAVMPLVLFVTRAPIGWALAIFSIAYFGQQSWSTLIMILPVDLVPTKVVGAVAGMVGFGGAIGGMVFNTVAGHLLDHGYGYGPVLAVAGSLHVVAFFVILIFIPTVRRLGQGATA